MAFVKEDDLYQEFVKHVQDYMFNNTNICKCLEHKIYEQFNDKKYKQNSEKINKNKELETFFIPKDNDSLFWCLYIIKNGVTNYSQLNNRNLIIEKKFKIDYVERLRKEKQLIKQYKFDTMTNIENRLVNEVIIDINTFFTLCVLGNLNIFFIKNKTYYELNMNDSNRIYIIKFLSDKKKYGFEETIKDNLDDLRNKYYKIDNIAKPIKTISAYKTQELIDICNKLEIETINTSNMKTKSKQELYETIIKYF
jgi:hypothetical protein